MTLSPNGPVKLSHYIDILIPLVSNLSKDMLRMNTVIFFSRQWDVVGDEMRAGKAQEKRNIG